MRVEATLNQRPDGRACAVARLAASLASEFLRKVLALRRLLSDYLRGSISGSSFARICRKKGHCMGKHVILHSVHQQDESESDNATEGVIWKARDLWSAPVKWSNHGMQAQKSSESMQSSAATVVGILRAAALCEAAVRRQRSRRRIAAA